MHENISIENGSLLFLQSRHVKSVLRQKDILVVENHLAATSTMPKAVWSTQRQDKDALMMEELWWRWTVKSDRSWQ